MEPDDGKPEAQNRSDLVKDAPREEEGEPNYTLCWVEKEDRHKFPELMAKSPAQHHQQQPRQQIVPPQPAPAITREGDGADDEEEEQEEAEISPRTRRGGKKPKKENTPKKGSSPQRASRKRKPNSNNDKQAEEDVKAKVKAKNKKTVQYKIDMEDPLKEDLEKAADYAKKLQTEIPALERSSSLALYLAQNKDTFVVCPTEKCKFVFERAQKPLNRNPTVIMGPGGEKLADEALRHRSDHRYRCRECQTEFCASCKASPYHLGKTCQQYRDEKNAKHCRFCKASLPKLARRENPQNNNFCSQCNFFWYINRRRRAIIQPDQIMCDSCPRSFCSNCVQLPPEDLNDPEKEWFCNFCETVCNGCEAKLLIACTRKLDCSHMCSGPKRQPYQLLANPNGLCFCLHPNCVPKDATNGDEFCNICWTDELSASPATKLSGCGHIFHTSCLTERLVRTLQGRDFHFENLECPLCRQLMQQQQDLPQTGVMHYYRHIAITSGQEALRRDGLLEETEKPESPYYKKPGEYALHIYDFHLCTQCSQPYVGGKRECANAVGGEREKRPDNEYICSSCSSNRCPKHGIDSMQFKCRFCCSPAVWFCFSSTHMCNPCHTYPRIDEIGGWLNTRDTSKLSWVKPCTDPALCPLGVAHPPAGEEFGFGCAECKAERELAEKEKDNEKKEAPNDQKKEDLII